MEQYYRDKHSIMYQGDAFKVLQQFSAQLVDCVVTSPPYFGKREYDIEPIVWDDNGDCEHEWGEIIKKFAAPHHGVSSQVMKVQAMTKDAFSKKYDSGRMCKRCDAWRGSLGMEPDLNMFIGHLADIFEQVKKALKLTGTCWINLGSKYENKSDLLIPEKLAIEMTGRGWYLRNKIVWHKNNPFPEPVKDRFFVDYELILFFTKSKDYYFEQQIVGVGDYKHNKGCVWKMNSDPFGGDHFASFPRELVSNIIKAGCPQGGIVMDPFTGTGRTGVVAKKLGRKFVGIELSEKYIKEITIPYLKSAGWGTDLQMEFV